MPGGAEGTNSSSPRRALTPMLPTEVKLLSAASTRTATLSTFRPATSPRAVRSVSAMSKLAVTSPLKASVNVPAVVPSPLSRTICTSYSCALLLPLLLLPATIASFIDMPRLATP